MKMRLSDIYRATLPSQSGNEGWIGLEPSGKTYHVIVPVDPQIARGVMACNLPTDGTPFGGYAGWLYFRCEPFVVDDEAAEEDQRKRMARRNAAQLVEFASGFGIAVSMIEDLALDDRSQATGREAVSQESIGRRRIPRSNSRSARPAEILKCTGCVASWEKITGLLVDPSTTFYQYRANTADFRKGYFVFRHSCGGVVEVLAARLGRSRFAGRSLAGSHACPGFCYYEASLSECSAVCEGSVYRRIARRLKTRRSEG